LTGSCFLHSQSCAATVEEPERRIISSTALR
jgi:hypothetical protein